MSHSERRYYLVSYDITEPTRLQAIHHYLRQRAVPLQYSVFLAYVHERGLQAILDGLAERIDPRTDDIRLYPLPADCQMATLGKDSLPLGVFLLPDAAGLLGTGTHADTAADPDAGSAH